MWASDASNVMPAGGPGASAAREAAENVHCRLVVVVVVVAVVVSCFRLRLKAKVFTALFSISRW